MALSEMKTTESGKSPEENERKEKKRRERANGVLERGLSNYGRRWIASHDSKEY